MILSERQNLLLDFVKLQHGEQKRKYTGEPYWNHLYSVAEIVADYEPNTFAIEIAFCHDLFEDTKCTFAQLHNNLIAFGYSRNVAYSICACVNELTDVFTSYAYPYMNRKKRKEEEAKRLGTISNISQSVKYADLIDNTRSIMERDKSFAKVYLSEKKDILLVMRSGNIDLLKKCDANLKLLSSINS